MKKFVIMDMLQLLGRSLMLPIAVLPVAGILLRLGQADLFDIPALAAAGAIIFENLALIFAAGVAVGIANDSHGAAALAGITAFLIFSGTLKTLDPTLDTGVLGGIICGIAAGAYYNRFKNIAFPEYLAFFGGRRFIPIISGATALVLAYLFACIWPSMQKGIDHLGLLMTESGSVGLFLYGFANRLLIITGLHHILNNLVWFQFGSFTDAAGKIVHGDITRFFAGDPAAGSFEAGLFPIMMFGLPAVALAIYRSALPQQRPLIGGMLFSVAFTSFLTGITEPIEFSFMFLAPWLYFAHALFTGLSMIIMGLLNVKLGFTFSAGAFDYILSYGKSTKGWLLLPVGLAFFALYYCVFKWVIDRSKLNLWENTGSKEQGDIVPARGNAGKDFVTALGGAENLPSIAACTTRLRLIVRDTTRIDEVRLKQLGAKAVMKLQNGNVQIILGPIADNIAETMRHYAKSHAGQSAAIAETAKPVPAFASHETDEEHDEISVTAWLHALGGKENLRSVSAVATTRLRLELANDQALNAEALHNLGVAAIGKLGDGLVHLIFHSGALPQKLAGDLFA